MGHRSQRASDIEGNLGEEVQSQKAEEQLEQQERSQKESSEEERCPPAEPALPCSCVQAISYYRVSRMLMQGGL